MRGARRKPGPFCCQARKSARLSTRGCEIRLVRPEVGALADEVVTRPGTCNGPAVPFTGRPSAHAPQRVSFILAMTGQTYAFAKNGEGSSAAPFLLGLSGKKQDCVRGSIMERTSMFVSKGMLDEICGPVQRERTRKDKDCRPKQHGIETPLSHPEVGVQTAQLPTHAQKNRLAGGLGNALIPNPCMVAMGGLEPPTPAL